MLKLTRPAAAGLVCFLFLSTQALANISNDGDDAVQIEISKKDGGIQRLTLYPGQSVATPKGTSEVRIVPNFKSRGDENLYVKVYEEDGNFGELRRSGESYKIGALLQQVEALMQTELTPGRVVNKGNITVNLLILRESGSTDKRMIYVGQPLTIPADTVEVKVVSDIPLRGDEIVEVSVTMPNGETETIHRLGGIIKLGSESF